LRKSTVSDETKRKNTRSFLSKSDISSEDSIQDNFDRAIEIGDWDAVGEHAASIIGVYDSDDSDETNSVHDPDESIDERINTLESLIEADDWKGFGKD